MKRKIVFKFLLTAWIFLAFFSSCKEIDLSNISNEVKIDESLVFPIGEGNASIGDLLKQLKNQSQYVAVADTINFVDSFIYTYAFKDIDILQYATPQKILIPLGAATIPANTSIPIPGTNQYLIDLGLDPNSTTKRVDNTYIKSTTIDVLISVSNLPITSTDLKVTLVFPTITKQSDNTVVSVDITPYFFNISYSLALNNVIVNSVGQTGVPVKVLLTTGNRSININSTSAINVGIKFNAVNYTVAYGLFQPSAAQSTSIKIPLDMLKSLPIGLQFANPKALINIQSNIGCWLDFDINYVNAYNKNKTIIKSASFNGSPSTSEIIKNKPLTPGLFMSWDLKTLDRNYGATNLLFTTVEQLDSLEYKFTLSAHPLSPAPSFVVPNMKMIAKVKLQIPLYFEKGSNYNYNDTIQKGNIDFSYIDQAILVLRITNGFPMKGTFTMKLLDASKVIIKSSLNDSTYVINSAEVDPQGLVTKSTLTPLNVTLTSAQMMDIKNAKFITYKVQLEGQDKSKAIQITKSNFINVKLGVFVKGGKTITIGSGNK